MEIISSEYVAIGYPTIAIGFMVLLLYKCCYYQILVMRAKRALLQERVTITHYLNANEGESKVFPTGMVRTALENKKQRDCSVEDAVKQEFYYLAITLGAMKEKASAQGLFFTILSLILFGLQEGIKVDAILPIFGTALITTALASGVAIWVGNILLDVKYLAMDVVAIVYETKL